MICKTSKEMLSEIKRYMDINDIQMKDLVVLTGKSQQSISQIFKNGNPRCSTIFEILDALNLDMDITLIKNNKSDTN